MGELYGGAIEAYPAGKEQRALLPRSGELLGTENDRRYFSVASFLRARRILGAQRADERRASRSERSARELSD